MKKHTMDPTSHVAKNDDTGMFCVYNIKNKKVAEFKTKPEADAYSKKSHDALMKEDAPANAVAGGGVDLTPGKKANMNKKPLKRFKEFTKEK